MSKQYTNSKENGRNSIEKRKSKAATKRVFLLLATAFIIVIGSMLFGNSFSSAKSDDSEVLYKYYKSIEIESGDSLWSIAKEYKSDDMSVQEYIDELMKLNNLTDETIHSGRNLIVMYYDTEFK